MNATQNWPPLLRISTPAKKSFMLRNLRGRAAICCEDWYDDDTTLRAVRHYREHLPALQAIVLLQVPQQDASDEDRNEFLDWLDDLIEEVPAWPTKSIW
jgi:hypothetical protein